MHLVKLFSILAFITIYMLPLCEAQMVKIVPHSLDSTWSFGNSVRIENNLINISCTGDYINNKSILFSYRILDETLSQIDNIGNLDLDEHLMVTGTHHYSFPRAVLSPNEMVVFDSIGLYAGLCFYDFIPYLSEMKQFIPLIFLPENSLQSDGIGNFDMSEDLMHIRYVMHNEGQETFRIDKLFKKQDSSWELFDSLYEKITTVEAFAYGYSIHSRLSQNFFVTGNYYDGKYGKRNGAVEVYDINEGGFELSEILYHPNPYLGNSYFGIDLDISADGQLLAIGAHDDASNLHMGVVYIYRLNNEEEYELFQTIMEDDPDFGYRYGYSVSLENDNLLIGDANSGADRQHGKVFYYRYNGEIFEKRGIIHPPLSDTTYASFGISVDQSGEFAIVGAQADSSLYAYNGAAYVFRIPARESIVDTICKGESYFFNDTMIYESGVYTDTLPSSYGVDSVIHLYLTVGSMEEEIMDAVLCPDEYYEIGDSLITSPGDYVIGLKNQYGCDSTILLYLTEVTDLVFEAEVSPDYACNSGRVSLIFEGETDSLTFSWSNGATTQDIDALSSGLYHLSIIDQYACESEFEFEVPLKDVTESYGIPNAFSPNGDAINDSYQVFFPEESGSELLSIQIFNRWGEKVYSATDNGGWDATYKNRRSPPGVFLYAINIKTACGIEKKKGNLLLLK